MHSTASDGVYSPAEVVNIALTNNVDVIALTDHDNVSGVGLAQEAAADKKLEVISGVELSAEDEQTDRHILGYLFDVQNEPLLAMLATLRNARVNRIEQMVQKLAALGIVVSLERVHKLAGDGSVGRPHLARIMLEEEQVGSVQEAFDKYIGDGGPAYVPHYRLAPQQAIDLIHSAGGIAVLAHPGHYEDFSTIIEMLVPCQLDGIEVYYFDHTRETITRLEGLANRYNLLKTVGSDFHRREGDGSARIGSVKAPPDLKIIESMRERAHSYQSGH